MAGGVPASEINDPNVDCPLFQMLGCFQYCVLGSQADVLSSKYYRHFFQSSLTVTTFLPARVEIVSASEDCVTEHTAIESPATALFQNCCDLL